MFFVLVCYLAVPDVCSALSVKHIYWRTYVILEETGYFRLCRRDYVGNDPIPITPRRRRIMPYGCPNFNCRGPSMSSSTGHDLRLS